MQQIIHKLHTQLRALINPNLGFSAISMDSDKRSLKFSIVKSQEGIYQTEICIKEDINDGTLIVTTIHYKHEVGGIVPIEISSVYADDKYRIFPIICGQQDELLNRFGYRIL